MNAGEIEILLLPEVRQAVEDNLGRDPLAVALDGKVPHAREVYLFFFFFDAIFP